MGSVLIRIILNCVCIGCSYEESSGEEHQVGEYVLENLELGSPEETGF